MLDFIAKGLAKVFGTKSDRDIKELLPKVKEINDIFSGLQKLSDEELRAQTAQIKETINSHLQELDDKIAGFRAEIEALPIDAIHQKDNLFTQIEQVEKERDESLEEVLEKVMPQAFAIVKETARRFKENGQLTVTATLKDKELAATKKNVEIDGDKAIWHNSWLAAGNEVVWDMVHYDVQLIGGMVLHKGKIAEMATGEGKTLVSTLPAYLNALAGRGVHIVTVNDYLAKRDSEWNAPLFEFHGLSVDCIDKYQPNSAGRKKAYGCDIVYGTNNEFGFDYLRDNMARDSDDLVQGKHHFAMVDEVDSVLIDDARTPLIISGPVPRGDVHEFDQMKPRVSTLVDEQRKLVQGFLTTAKKLIAEGNEKEGGLALFRAYRGMPKYKPLIKYLSEPGIRVVLQKTENYYLQDNKRNMPEADEPLLFTIDEKSNVVDLTDRGIETMTTKNEDPSFFIMPDIGVVIADLEKDESIDEKEKLVRKEEAIKDYGVKAQRIHTVNQLLKAYCMFERDTEYIIVDGKVKIVDEQTGRVMEGRRYSDGLHQAIEAKENVKVEDATQTYATITLQNYFRMYHKLAGMTGTAETEAGEFWEIYKLDVVVIPTNKPIQRDDREDKVYKTVREKFNAVVDEINELVAQGRPVLVGTTSVEISEVLSRMLTLKKIPHQVLNAKQHAKEADVVAEAGKAGTVTIATNMAGRGTDIKLSPESKKAGGLAIIGTERHESRRVDRQLRGRAGRQGDVGSSQFFVSLEDSLMRLFGSDRIAKLMDRMGLEEGEVIQHSMITKSIERAQRKVEENNFGTRKRLLEYDDVMNSQREVVYKRRRNALKGERLELDILNILYDVCESIVEMGKSTEDLENLRMNIFTSLGLDYQISENDLKSKDASILTQELYEAAFESYQKKNQQIITTALPILRRVQEERGATVKDIMVPISDGIKQIGVVVNLEKMLSSEGNELIRSLEKNVTLAIIDQNWKEHLRDMDDLKQSVQNAVYEQKDPLLIYKFEAFEMFKRFIGKLNEDMVSFLTRADLPKQDPSQVQQAQAQRAPEPQVQASKAEVSSSLNPGANRAAAAAASAGRQAPQAVAPRKSEKTYGRNDRVTVQYTNGTLKEDVKYKSVEQDVQEGKCVIIDN
ncbi:MAG TPA: preprotein translocase subunit SecA [Algoriphagus sp.]|jgi:preprotein translocase subunit SecA|uniref:preprotein translocase subunit SecA n=1 Tax=unclassified Algoriphagus TaxID=2641541 RepID=UPI000C60336A|nr:MULTISPECIES: preprotein translocase subunit SecA [unclassified Algoriphagus]MAL12143.1 preprotein translocase subunit SecA [Algoriphagus sp.]HAS59642.1 preprotein translocase subunit SecA [Algoriphagus sp.]HCD86672.1 preprotein translocase subunit SecA [Algoriphagus sp.]HCH45363.1 preprotein translocase subunit SecA [Algoriphagus sp.]